MITTTVPKPVPVTVILERLDGTTDTLEIAESGDRYDFVRMIFTAGGCWSKDHKTFTPWHQIKLFSVAE
jgi:hypothetical protein